jgi:hypothetical protein
MGNKDSCENLVISYIYLPDKDLLGIVQTKRIFAENKNVDLLMADSGNYDNMEFLKFADEHINKRMVIDMKGKTLDSKSTIFEFIEKGMAEIEKDNAEYKHVSSICWRIANHFFALEYKLNHPEVFWSAEFVDPLLYTTESELRYLTFDDEKYVSKINEAISKIGDYPLIENPTNLYLLVEYLPFLFADEIIFTNENQREIMLTKHPYDVYDMVMEKSRILPIPPIDKEYYYLKDVDIDLDKDSINIAYFGSYYFKRNFESIFYAFDSLNHKYKNKIKFYMYIDNKELIKELVKGLDIEENIIIKDQVEYLEFLNLTTKFDVLVANDLVSEGNFKLNPYLPSKVAEYSQSGRDMWIIYENGSTLSKMDAKYKSNVKDYTTSRDVLTRILEDNGYIDEDISHDEYYFDKRLTLFMKYLQEKMTQISSKDKQINDLKTKNKNLEKKINSKDKQIKDLKTKNKELEKLNKEILSSNSWKITKPLRKIRKK